MAAFTIKLGSVDTVSGTTEGWGVTTVGQAVNHPRAKSALMHPDNVIMFVSGIQVQPSAIITDGVTITLNVDAGSKGRI